MNIILVTGAIHLGTWEKFNILVSNWQSRSNDNDKSYLKFRLGKLNKEGEILTVQNETRKKTKKWKKKNRNEI
jgi:hypothetical protein